MFLDLGKFIKSVETQEKEKEYKDFIKDERIWNLKGLSKLVKDEKWTYKIRILPLFLKNSEQGYDLSYNTHSFRSPITGKLITEMCPSTIGNPCPICEYSYSLWNSSSEIDKKLAKPYFKNNKYATNIIVVQEAKPERKDNEGKVFVWTHGRKLHDKFKNAVMPPKGEETVFFVDPEEGYDFVLIAKRMGDYVNFDDSYFSRTKTTIAPDRKGIEAILKQCYDIEDMYLNPSNFKSYKELSDMVNTLILGKSPTISRSANIKVESQKLPVISQEEDIPDDNIKTPSSIITEAKKSEVKEDDDFLSQLENELNGI